MNNELSKLTTNVAESMMILSSGQALLIGSSCGMKSSENTTSENKHKCKYKMKETNLLTKKLSLQVLRRGWATCLLTIILLVIGQTAWADTAVLATSTMDKQSTGYVGPVGTSTADGNVMVGKSDGIGSGWILQCNNLGKGCTGATTITIDETSYSSLKNSNGAKHTVKVPDGYVATSVTFYAVSNYTYDSTHGTALLSEINGTACSDEIADKDATPTVITKSLDEVTTFTFTFSVTQVNYAIVVTYTPCPCSHTICTDGSIGAADNTTAWWTQFSPFYSLASGESREFSFTNYGTTGDNSNNWYMFGVDSKHHNGDTGYTLGSTLTEYFALRQDRWDEKQGYDGMTWTVSDNTDFTNFQSDMTQAQVNLKIARNENTLYFYVKTTAASGRIYYMTYTRQLDNLASDGSLYLYFTIKNSHITDFTASDVKSAYSVDSGISGGSGAVSISNSDGIAIPEDTYVNADETIIYTATPDEGYIANAWTVNNGGTAGTVSNNTKTYTISSLASNTTALVTFVSSSGVYFANSYQIYDFSADRTHTQTISGISGIKYEIIEKYGEIASYGLTIDESTGTIGNLPTFDENKGGAVVVKASTSDGSKTATYVLTVPYKKYVWNFYQEGDGFSDTNPVSRIVTGPLVNYTNPGAANLVEEASTISYTKYDDACTEATISDLKKKQTWLTYQQTATDAYASYYWDYTFKTCTSTSGKVTYTNGSLFSYKKAVNGDNARVVTNTQGLLFKCSAGTFGLNDNRTSVSGYGINTARNVREMNRAILVKGTAATLTIPHVSAGYYVKLYWYRHSDNAGDQFTVQNAKDLDGNNISSTDVLRFTGSSYYSVFGISAYKGCTFLQPQYDGADIIINIANNNWTEIYLVEVTDTYETDLKICEEEIAGYDSGVATATTDQWNALDINNPDNYNNVEHSHNTSELVSKIYTHAKGDGLIEYAPNVRISGYPGHCFTWNGWLNTTLQADVEGTASCECSTNTEFGVDNACPNDPVRVGRSVKYSSHLVNKLKGVGTIKLTLRTHSGGTGEPHYTLDKVEAYVAVGEYSVQDYPYTWDFTKYNVDKNNAYGGKTFDVMANSSVNVMAQYGSWLGGTASYNMGVYTSLNYDDPQTSDGHKLNSWDVRHKPFFAQGAQLSLGDQSPHTILETEGLCFNIPAVNADNNKSVIFYQTGHSQNSAKARRAAAHTDDLDTNGAIEVAAGSTITIPEVSEGMYLFVKGTTPSSATNTTTSDVTFAENNDNDVTYYKATGGDVALTFNSAATLYKIGVTDQIKTIAYFGYSTESRACDIDYNETRYFSADVSGFYVTDVTGAQTAGTWKVTTNATTSPMDDRLYVPAGTGIVLKDNDITYSATDKDSNKANSPKVPLFVPACNISQATVPSSNLLVATTTKDQESASIKATLVSGTDYPKYYTLSNYYVKVADETNSYVSDKLYTDTPNFYRYVGTGNNTQSATLTNMAYLKFDSESASKVRYLSDIIGVDFGDADGIQQVIADDVYTIEKASGCYNLGGQKLDSTPTSRGIYIINGKKVYVK